MYSPTFQLLLNEGYLLRGCLQAALNSLLKSSNASREHLYTAFFTYAIGLERLLKLTLILNHCIEKKGSLPTHAEIKSFGHNLRALYNSAEKIVQRYSIDIPDECRIDDIDQRLIDLLAEFAISGRYFNLDALTGGGKSEDPLPVWGELLNEIYQRDVPPLKRISDEEQVEALAGSMKETTVYLPATGFDGATQSYEQFFADHGKITLVMPEVVWRCARILYPLQMLIFELDQPLRQTSKPEHFPVMWEICAFCGPDKESTLAEIAGY